MTIDDIQNLAKSLALILREMLKAERAQLLADVGRQLADVKSSIPLLPEIPPIDTDLIVRAVLESLPEQKAVEGPPGKDGRDGIDGKDGAPGKDGRDGIDGKEGPPGKDGRDGIDGKDGAPGRDGTDGKEGPPGRDGERGADGAAGPEGPQGKEGPAGRDGRDGADGVSPEPEAIAALFERRFSDILLSFERRFTEVVDKCVQNMPTPKDGRDGRDGTDGRDAFPLEAFSFDLGDDERTIVMRFEAGDAKIVKELRLPYPVDRGVWSPEALGPDQPYRKGDGVTFGGSFFIAQVDSPASKPGTSNEWRLAVKKGRDGRDFRPSASTHDPVRGVSIK